MARKRDLSQAPRPRCHPAKQEGHVPTCSRVEAISNSDVTLDVCLIMTVEYKGKPIARFSDGIWRYHALMLVEERIHIFYQPKLCPRV
jgi:hypothetical protein